MERSRFVLAVTGVAVVVAFVGLSGVVPPTQPPPLGFLPPRGYVCYFTTKSVKIDGRLDDPAWQDAPWTEYFVDIEGDRKLRPRFKTRAKMLWNKDFFYIAAEMEEPHVWGTLTQHDAVIFQDNDFEVFIDPNGDNHEYYEFEINALNTSWDLFLPRPYRDGGSAMNHWEIPGLKTAVHVDGTLNDARDVDRGWSVELAIPWSVLKEMAARPAPPLDGDQWRVNFSRVEWQHEIVQGKYRKIKDTKEDNWVWSPQGVIDMHQPEMWGYVQFSTAPPGRVAFRPDEAGPAKYLLYRVYKAQQAYRKTHQKWAQNLKELGLAGVTHPSLTRPPALQTTEFLFQADAEIRDNAGRKQRWVVRQDSKVWKVEKVE